ncbi:class I SAM-dependent methyltransferase [Streptomyces sp. NPDC014603]|uniref:class I SAM-dependent methyltransferase n=1 Tax=Streptomyces sp. NPDC014603 TaxID=3364873 RepID=UPI00370363CF
MTNVMDTTQADRALKAKHRAMWAQGDYPAVAAELIPGLGAVLVEACGVGPGDRVLDVAAGTGNAAIPAALAGAEVVASDLTPELLETGRRLAEDRGARLSWETADAEALPYEDASFDTVLSCVGVMFAPHHRAAADELLRVCRPGGTIGLVSWTPEGSSAGCWPRSSRTPRRPRPARSRLRCGATRTTSVSCWATGSAT